MGYRARAPGKLVVLGEYAVLTGCEALVMAVDRCCTAELAPLRAPRCELEVRAAAHEVVTFPAAAPSGVALVDHVVAAFGVRPELGAWRGRLDTGPFFVDGRKLGFGSSAAALCAFAGVWSARNAGSASPRPSIDALIACHRAFQGGLGSGLDVAAAVTGGSISYRIGPGGEAVVGSVRLPNSVAFAGVFTGASASTPDFVEQFERWRASGVAESPPLLEALSEASEAGCAAAREGDARGFLAAVEGYGRLLGRLGQQIGREIVTRAHAEVGALARRFGVAYKTSGAGGGDLGLAFCADRDALAAFGVAVRAANFAWVQFGLDQDGLIVEERL